MSALGRKLRIVFSHGVPVPVSVSSDPEEIKREIERWNAEHGNYRYVPRHRGDKTKGQWGVWDKKLDRFLDEREIREIPDESLRDEKVMQS